MAINFPDTPTNGQTTTVGNVVYAYNSTVGAWEIVSSGGIGTITTKGDILSRSSSGLSRVEVGSNNQVLTANSGTSTGLQWVDRPWNSSWGVISMQELANGAVIGGNPATITSMTFTHVAGRRIEIRAYGRLSFSGTTNSALQLRDGSTQIAYWDYPSQSFVAGVISRIVSSSSSSKTYDVRLHMGATQTLTVLENYAITAIDLGPA